MIKKHSIGYNTVTSVDGIISTRGVKSKPNDIRIFGYTHEIGDGEKSPDNPYKFVSLDSGNMSVNGVEYEHSITLTNNNTTIKIPVPIALNSVENINDKIVKKNNEYYIEQNINDIVVNEESSIMLRAQQNGYTKFNIDITNGRIVNTNKIICNKLLVSARTLLDAFQYEYIRSSISKYPDLLVAYILTNRVTSNTTATKQELCSYLQNNNIRILYQVNIPQYLKLSDYAQELLNSFVLENKNNISVKGNPTFKITGYLQKRGD